MDALFCYCVVNIGIERDHKGTQLTQKHVFWDITRQTWSSSLTPSSAKEQTKKHRPLAFHPFVGVTPWTDCHAICGMEWRPQHNHPCQILFKSVKRFLGGSTQKSGISYTFSNDPYYSSALPCRLWSLVPLVVNMLAKFEVSSLNRSEIWRGSQNYDPFPTPFDPLLNLYLHSSSTCKGASGVLQITGSNTVIFVVLESRRMSPLHW